jgi:hypothetical protein
MHVAGGLLLDRTRPAVAVTVSIFGITFGLIQCRTMERVLTTGLLYGVPMATVFARRDWEHAVGAHYMVNMLSWVVGFVAVQVGSTRSRSNPVADASRSTHVTRRGRTVGTARTFETTSRSRLFQYRTDRYDY